MGRRDRLPLWERQVARNARAADTRRCSCARAGATAARMLRSPKWAKSHLCGGTDQASACREGGVLVPGAAALAEAPDAYSSWAYRPLR